MNLTMACALMTVGLAVAQVVYGRLARRLGLIDRPNNRSLHTGQTTIRGGGILFFLAELGAFVYSGLASAGFFAGLTLVAAVSFWDDVRPLPARYRLAVQFVGMALLLQETGLPGQNGWVLAGLLVVGAGILNAHNFMDGINGMTAWCGLVSVGTLWVWQWQWQLPMADAWLPFMFLALLVFSVVNARRRAICFAGDVGSMSLGFVVLWPLILTIQRTQSYLPVLLLAVYGTDTVLTILHRLYRRQPVFRAHREHLFQQLVTRHHWPHLRVSALYALLQLLINILIMSAFQWSTPRQWMLAGGMLTALTTSYIIGKQRP